MYVITAYRVPIVKSLSGKGDCPFEERGTVPFCGEALKGFARQKQQFSKIPLDMNAETCDG